MPLSPSRVAANALRLLPRKGLSRSLGRVAGVEAPGRLLNAAMDAYCRAYGVDLSDCIVPEGGFDSFDAFFTRQLADGARPLDPDPRAVLSPADGRIEDAGVIEPDASFRIKGRPYTVGELVGEIGEAPDYQGGLFAVVYLSPRDYHRVHAPVDGIVWSLRHVDGTLFPVNRIGVEHVPRLFARNERLVVQQLSEQLGRVATIMVGAMFVGRISVSFDPEVQTNRGRATGLQVYGEDGPQLARGDELGAFHLGSTAIVLLPPDRGLRLVKGPGDVIRMGEALARGDVDG